MKKTLNDKEIGADLGKYKRFELILNLIKQDDYKSIENVIYLIEELYKLHYKNKSRIVGINNFNQIIEEKQNG